MSVTGDFGKAPEVTWNGQVTTDTMAKTTLIEGEGEDVAKGDKVNIDIWIGNGFTKAEAYTTWKDGKSTPAEVELLDGVLGALLEGTVGHQIGDRTLVVAPPKDAFGEAGNPDLGIGNEDNTVFIIDIVGKVIPPKPVDVPATKMPKLVLKDGEPTGFDFTGIAKPDAAGDLQRTVLTEGTGDVVTTSMTVTANYLGAIYKGKKPFDESFSKEPVPFALTGVIGGWTYGLEGLKVGSRVLLAIPPRYGYADQAQAEIPANSTLYFVVDIVAAK